MSDTKTVTKGDGVQKTTLKEFMNAPSIQTQLKELLGRNSSSFITTILQVVANNKLLKTATKSSVYGAALTAASMNLSINPNLGFAYIVPYARKFKDEKGNWVKVEEAQFQMGWKGFVQLAQRTGKYKTINATEVYENQLGEIDYRTGDIQMINEPPIGKVVGYLAYFSLLNGFEKTFYMSREEMEKHAKNYSQSYKKGYGVWADGVDGFNSMARKTVLKLLLNKFGPLSIEMEKAVEFDQAVTTDGETIEYPDNDEPEVLSGDDAKAELRKKKTVAPEMP